MSEGSSPMPLGHELEANMASLREAVLSWAETRLRDLPWRRTRDPWAVLVSELMLQQTQVSRVLPRFATFLEAFPTPSACADAPAAHVIRAWQGLGYNRRAVYLHQAAVTVRDDLAGVMPDSLDGLLALPGIGAYTARAVLAFAHGHDVGVVDTNVARVLARWQGSDFPPAQRQALADTFVPTGAGWSWNQAMLDLGATICTARQAHCDGCPARSHCAWRGGPGSDPWRRGPRQRAFAGSDRQGRGRLVDALRSGPVSHSRLAETMGWPDDVERSRRVAQGVVRDGLAHRTSSGFEMPDGP